MKVYLATIDNTYDGAHTTVHRTEKGAWENLGEYLIWDLKNSDCLIYEEDGPLVPNPDIFVGEETPPVDDPVEFAKSWGEIRFWFRRELLTVSMEEKEVLE